jgi:hypothetical protein
MSRILTENNRMFLNVLFEGANGDIVQAKKLAGYSETSSTNRLIVIKGT